MFYSTLLDAFNKTNLEQHDYVCKVTQGKDVKFTVVKKEANKTKDKTALKLVEILHILKTEKKKISFINDAKLKAIVTHMTEQKIRRTSTCGLILCIRNFFSKLQNKFNGFGFKTSLEIAKDFTNDSPTKVAKDIPELIGQISSSTSIDKAKLDRILKSQNLGEPIFDDEGTLLHQLLRNPAECDVAWITSLIKLSKKQQDGTSELINKKEQKGQNKTPIWVLMKAMLTLTTTNCCNLLKELASNGADLNVLDSYRSSLLHDSIMLDLPTEIVKLFMTPQNLKHRNESGTVLQYLENRSDRYHRREDVRREIILALKDAMAKLGSDEGRQEQQQRSNLGVEGDTTRQDQRNLGLEDRAPRQDQQPKPLQSYLGEDGAPIQKQQPKTLQSNLGEDGASFGEEVVGTKHPLEGVKIQEQMIEKKITDILSVCGTFEINSKMKRERVLMTLFIPYGDPKSQKHLSLDQILECVKLLKELGADINYAVETGKSILYKALAAFSAWNITKCAPAEDQQKDIINKLIEMGAKPNKTIYTLVINSCNNPKVIETIFKDIDKATEDSLKDYIKDKGTKEVKEYFAKRTNPSNIPATQVQTTTAKDTIIDKIFNALPKNARPDFSKDALKNSEEKREELFTTLFLYGSGDDEDWVMSLKNIMDCAAWLQQLGVNVNCKDKIISSSTILADALNQFPKIEATDEEKFKAVETLLKMGVLPDEEVFRTVIKSCNIPAIVELVLNKMDEPTKEKLKVEIKYAKGVVKQYFDNKNGTGQAAAEPTKAAAPQSQVAPQVKTVATQARGEAPPAEKTLNKQIIELLPSKYAFFDEDDLNLKEKREELFLAIFAYGNPNQPNGHMSLNNIMRCVDWLKQLGINVSCTEKFGKTTVLSSAIHNLTNYIPSTDEEKIKTIKTLMDMGVEPNEEDFEGIRFCRNSAIVELVFNKMDRPTREKLKDKLKYASEEVNYYLGKKFGAGPAFAEPIKAAAPQAQAAPQVKPAAQARGEAPPAEKTFNKKIIELLPSYAFFDEDDLKLKEKREELFLAIFAYGDSSHNDGYMTLDNIMNCVKWLQQLGLDVSCTDDITKSSILPIAIFALSKTIVPSDDKKQIETIRTLIDMGVKPTEEDFVRIQYCQNPGIVELVFNKMDRATHEKLKYRLKNASEEVTQYLGIKFGAEPAVAEPIKAAAPQARAEVPPAAKPLHEKIVELLPSYAYVNANDIKNSSKSREDLLLSLFYYTDPSHEEGCMTLDDVMKCVTWLKDLGTNINCSSNIGETVLSRAIYAFFSNKPPPSEDEQIAKVKELLEKGVIPNEETYTSVKSYCKVPAIIELVFNKMDRPTHEKLKDKFKYAPDVLKKYLENKFGAGPANAEAFKAAEPQIQARDAAPKVQAAAPLQAPKTTDEKIDAILKLVPNVILKPSKNDLKNEPQRREDLLLDLFYYTDPSNKNAYMTLDDAMKCVTWLKDLGTNINCSVRGVETVLSRAIFAFSTNKPPQSEAEQIAIVTQLLEMGVKPNEETFKNVMMYCKVPIIIELLLVKMDTATYAKLNWCTHTEAVKQYFAKRDAAGLAPLKDAAPPAGDNEIPPTREGKIDEIIRLAPKHAFEKENGDLQTENQFQEALEDIFFYDFVEMPITNKIRCIKLLLALGAKIDKLNEYNSSIISVVSMRMGMWHKNKPKDEERDELFKELLILGAPRDDSAYRTMITNCKTPDVVKFVFDAMDKETEKRLKFNITHGGSDAVKQYFAKRNAT